MFKVVHSKAVITLFQTTGRSTEKDKNTDLFHLYGSLPQKVKVIWGTLSRKKLNHPIANKSIPLKIGR